MEHKSYASLTNDGERILAQNITVSNNSWKTGRNNNDLIIGPTGSGKTRYYVKPNLLNASESLVITDTKGNLAEEMTPALEEAGYDIMLLDLTRPAVSLGYNPFDYIAYDSEADEYSQKDIATMAEILYGECQSGDEPYWDMAAKGVLRSMIAYLMEATIPKDHTVESLSSLLRLIRTSRDSEMSPYAQLLEDLKEDNPDSYAASQYAMAIDEKVDKTSGCIKMFLGSALSQFNSKEIAGILTRKKRVDILRLARRKTALFLTISDMDRSQDKLANLFYAQALQVLCRYADRECPGNCLPVPVRFILADFATNACIPDFDKHISVIRSRGISVSIILQSVTQLNKMYGEYAATTILNGCDTLLYLGGHDVKTADYIGTRTDRRNFDVLNMPVTDAWLMLRGDEPKRVRRYDLTQHPRYSLLAEAGAVKCKARSADNEPAA